MDKYIFSGNETLLEELKNIYGDNMTYSSDYEKLLSLQNEDCLIAYIYDKSNPIDLKGHETPYLFNEFRHVEEGKLLCDKHIQLETAEIPLQSRELKEIEGEIDALVKLDDTIEMIRNNLKNGDMHVMFEGTFFSGGRGEDSIFYTLFDNNKNEVGCLTFGEHDFLDIKLKEGEEENWYANYGWYIRTNKGANNIIHNTVFSVLERDDKEYYNAFVDEDGNINEPYAYCDISREDAINRTYEEDMAEER